MNVERPNITIPESVLEVEICVVLTSGVPEQVIVTAVTGPKSGAAYPATGRLLLALVMTHEFRRVLSSCSWLRL